MGNLFDQYISKVIECHKKNSKYYTRKNGHVDAKIKKTLSLADTTLISH